jgi:hypothetical protein
MNRFFSWLKINFVFALIMFVLVIVAVLSVSYAFLSTNESPPAATAGIESQSKDHLKPLPLAEEIATNSVSVDSQNSGSVILGANTKCLDNKTALTAVNLKMTQEINRHEGAVKEIGHGGLLKQVIKEARLSQEHQKHQNAMELLQIEYNDLLSQIDC